MTINNVAVSINDTPIPFPAVRAGATALAKLCGPTLDTHSGSEPTLSTDASEAGPTLAPSHANATKEQR